MSKKKKPTLTEIVEKWRTLLNSNAQASLGRCDMDILVEILGAWINDVTEDLRGEARQVAFVDPEQHRRLCDRIATTMAKFDKRGER